jgi:AcrR family transcriptional regulator
MELAERDGYDAVRLRDVAEQAEVALGTVYRRYSCKEDILASVLNRQVSMLKQTVEDNPGTGATPEDRLGDFFEQITSVLAAAPKLAGAMLRTVASGVPELVERVSRYRGEMTSILLMVMRGGEETTTDLTAEQEEVLASVLQDVLFAALVGWTGGLHDTAHVVAHLNETTQLLFRGARSA